MCLVYDDQRAWSKPLTPTAAASAKTHDPSLQAADADPPVLHTKCRPRVRKVRFAPALSTQETSHPVHKNDETDNNDDDDDDDNEAAVRTDIIDTILPSSSMSQEERSTVHWQPADYAYFRGSARVIAEEVRKVASSTTQRQSSRSYNSVLSRTLEICHLVAHDRNSNPNHSVHNNNNNNNNKEHKEEDDDDDDVELCIPPRLFSALTDWTKEGHSRRGIERYCVDSHGTSRPLSRQQAIEAVLVTQQLLKQRSFQEGGFRVGDVELPSNLSHEEITRLVSREFTRSSKLYALAMGHADAAAVGNLGSRHTSGT